MSLSVKRKVSVEQQASHLTERIFSNEKIRSFFQSNQLNSPPQTVKKQSVNSSLQMTNLQIYKSPTYSEKKADEPEVQINQQTLALLLSRQTFQQLLKKNDGNFSQVKKKTIDTGVKFKSVPCFQQIKSAPSFQQKLQMKQSPIARAASRDIVKRNVNKVRLMSEFQKNLKNTLEVKKNVKQVPLFGPEKHKPAARVNSGQPSKPIKKSQDQIQNILKDYTVLGNLKMRQKSKNVFVRMDDLKKQHDKILDSVIADSNNETVIY